MDHRFPPLAPPETRNEARAVSLPVLPISAFPLAEWSIFAAILSLLLRV